MLRYALLISIFARICNQRIAGLGGTSVPHAMCPVLGVWLFAIGRVGVAWPALVCSYPALAAGKCRHSTAQASGLALQNNAQGCSR